MARRQVLGGCPMCLQLPDGWIRRRSWYPSFIQINIKQIMLCNDSLGTDTPPNYMLRMISIHLSTSVDFVLQSPPNIPTAGEKDILPQKEWSHNSNDINMHIIQHYYDMLGSNSPSRRMLLTLNVKWEIWYLWVSTYPRTSLHPSRMHKHNVFIFIILHFL